MKASRSTNNMEKRMNYFLPNLSSTKKLSSDVFQMNKNSKFIKDQSLPEIHHTIDSPNTNQRPSKNDLITNKAKMINNSRTSIKKNSSDGKIISNTAIKVKKKGQLNRKIQNFKKLYNNKLLDDPKQLSRNRDSPESPTKSINIKNRLIKEKVEDKKPQIGQVVKAPMFNNKIDLERENVFTEDLNYLQTVNKNSSPILKIGRSQNPQYLTKINSNNNSPLKKNKFDNKKITLPTEQAYNTISNKQPNDNRTQSLNKKKDLEEQILQLNRKFPKSSSQMILSQKLYQSWDKKFRDRKNTIQDLHREKGIDDHEEKVLKLKKLGIQYMGSYMQFQQMLLQLKLHQGLTKKENESQI